MMIQKIYCYFKNGNNLYRFDNTVISPSIFQDLDDYLDPMKFYCVKIMRIKD